MKTASTATLNILASGSYVVYDLYQFSLTGGQVLYVADSDFPLTVGGQLYQHGLVIARGDLKQSCDLSVQSMKLDIAPQLDIPGGPPTIGGFPFLAAVRQGFFDSATVQYSRLYLVPPSPGNYNWPDTSPGAVPWFNGVIADTSCGRLKATFSVNNTIELLNVQMPRNLVQAGCSHMLYDAGCTLLKSSFRVSGAMTGTPSVLAFDTNLTQADHYFDLGVITMTSGVNNGISRTVRTSLNASGYVQILLPFNTAPSAGDTFTILPGCDKQQSTCTTKFSNLAHFRGMPYVPVPETIYDGSSATSVPSTLQPIGPGSGAGSGGRFTYKP